MGRLGLTIVSRAHGSYLTCHQRLGCTVSWHRRLRYEYLRKVDLRRRREAGVRPARRGRTHGLRSTYRVCTLGPGGRPCQACRDAEASYKAAWRAAQQPQGAQ